VAASLLVCGAALLSSAPAEAAPTTFTVCPTGCALTTIQAAVTAAVAGDTINVGEGTYNEFGIVIDKPLTITGAGLGKTVVNGGGTSVGSVPGIFRILPGDVSQGGGDIKISRMTLKNPGKDTTATQYYDISIAAKQVTTGIGKIELDRLDLQGPDDKAHDGYGIYADGGVTDGADRDAPEISLTKSKVKGQSHAGIGLDAWRGKATIADNDLNEGTSGRGAILVMNGYTTSRMTDPVIVKDNKSAGRLVYVKNYAGPTFGGYDDIQITGNTINDLAGGSGSDCNVAAGPDCGILVSSNAASSGGATLMDKVLITGNKMRGDGVSTSTAGVFIGGDVKDVKVNENSIVGVGNGINVAQDQGRNAVAVTARHNRLFADKSGLRNATTAAIDATENWWGCQGGPASGSSYCSSVDNTGPGSIGASTWVITTAAADSASIAAGKDIGVTGSLGKLNNGTSLGLPAFFTGLASAFNADKGKFNPNSGTLDQTYSDSKKYRAPASAMADTITVTLDREEFTGTRSVSNAAVAAYGDAVVTGEPVPVKITVGTPDDPADGNADDSGTGDSAAALAGASLPATGGPAAVSALNIGMALMSIVMGFALVVANRERRPTSRHRSA